MIDLLMALVILAQPGHPKLYKTPADIERARLNIQRFNWAKGYFKDVQARADKWTARSNAELRSLVPQPGSTFAYGFSGCPECGANWPWWGAGGIASFDKPGKVQCPSCERVFPDADHPDTGNGWKSAKDGKTYYFVGCYNSFAMQRITLDILHDLSVAYSVTGDSKYSRAAASIYGSLAALYQGTTEGSADYPSDNNLGWAYRLIPFG